MSESPHPDADLGRWAKAWTTTTTLANGDPVLEARRAMRRRRLRLWLGAGLGLLTLAQLIRFGLLQDRFDWWLWSGAMVLYLGTVQVLDWRIERRNREALIQDADSARRWMAGNAEAGLRLVRLNIVGTALLIPAMSPLAVSLVQQGQTRHALLLGGVEALVILGSLLWSRWAWRRHRRALEAFRREPEQT